MKFNVETLSNGIAVATDHIPNTEIASIHWSVRSGARHDVIPGTAHFLEHFIGAASSGPDDEEAYPYLHKIANQDEANFHTSLDSIGAHCDTSVNHIPPALSTLGRTIDWKAQNPKVFPREKKRIGLEYLDNESDGEETCETTAIIEAYAGHSIGHSNLGSKEDIQRIQLSDLFNFYQLHFCGTRMLVNVSSSLEQKYILELASEAFGHIPRGTSTPAQNKPAFKFGGLFKYIKPGNQHICLGFQGTPRKDPQFEALYVLLALYDNHLSRMVENRALTYASPVSNPYAYYDHGHILINAVTEAKKVNIVAQLMLETAMNPQSWCTRKAYEEYLIKRHMSNIRTHGPDHRASKVSEHFQFCGTIISPEEIDAREAKVTFEDVLDAYSLWDLTEFNVVTYGPANNIMTPQKLLGTISPSVRRSCTSRRALVPG